jgi:hypothetical protein
LSTARAARMSANAFATASLPMYQSSGEGLTIRAGQMDRPEKRSLAPGERRQDVHHVARF